MSFRERIQRMRDGKGSIPAPLQSVAPKDATSDSSKALLTPPFDSPSPECPGAPRKKKLNDFHRLGQGVIDTDEDILLDKKANGEAKQPPAVIDASLHCSYNTTAVDNGAKLDLETRSSN